MPKIVYLIRHGETEDNKNKIFQGWRDSILTDAGHNQAQKLANNFSGKNISAIYTSDLKRTCETAKYLEEKLGLKAKKSKALREHNLGLFEGWEWQSDLNEMLKDLWKEYLSAREKGNLKWNKHNGESLYEFQERVRKFFKYLDKNHDKDNVILVTHGGTKNRILEVLEIKPTEEEYIPFENTSVTTLIKKGSSYTIKKINDSSHLTD